MANFNAATLTRKGIGLLAKAQAGLTGIHITKAAAGDGAYGLDESLAEATALKNQRQEFPFDKLSVSNDTTVAMKFTITNEQAQGNLQEGYHVKEVGVFAEDPDEGEILYAIATAVENQWDYMPAYNSLMPAYITVEFYAEVSNASEVTINCSGRFITAEEAEAEHKAIREEANAEHGEIRKLIADANQAIEALSQGLENALTKADKGAANGVASLNRWGFIPTEQLPYESGAMYLGEKLGFDSFAWSPIEGDAGWVGVYTTAAYGGEYVEYIKGLTSTYWAELMLIPDLDRLYGMYTEKYANSLAVSFCGLHFKAFVTARENRFDLKVFSDENLGESETVKVAFWPYLLRKGVPNY